MKIKIYYGLSGTMKGSTIEAEKRKIPDLRIMESKIKSWKHYQFGLFKDRTEYSDLTYSILHLVRLEEFLKQKGNLLIERGVTDPLFYHYYNGGCQREEDTEFIKSIVQEELSLLHEPLEVKKVLLVQEDKDFVRNVILQDEYRKRTFRDDPNLYFDLQSKYVDFTQRYNKIDEVVRIKNAKDYIINTLGVNWK